ncbi:MAG: tRNA (adenosine(37)-N6)-threonylcarbamoyltransferase complex ATPase subunit type 1 TsaE [Candidatus Paceibacterota bacterium]|jgi:tRNA threonylcarbamoyladenosine biosynthesis protein TsaE
MISKSLKETENIAKDFIKNIKSSKGALVVGLYGDLGSAKTTFTQFVAKTLGIKEDITSPTFVIEKIYDIKHKDLKRFIHIDAYRLNSAKELSVLGWQTTVSDPTNIVFIEWPERVVDILPKDHIKINFKFISENEREITICLGKIRLKIES